MTQRPTQTKHINRALRYIDGYWKKLTYRTPDDEGLRIGLPHPYVAPSNGFFSAEQFYWDSYFIILGLVASGRVKLARGMVDNIVYLYRRFGVIPARNLFYNIVGSQPPFLTSMALEVYEHDHDRAWLASVAEVAERELGSHWLSEEIRCEHLVYRGLSRYTHHHATALGVQYESGWDFGSRFDSHALDVLPVDLNALLYKYETDLADIAKLGRHAAAAAAWRRKARARQKIVSALMWDNNKKFFFDYDYCRRKRSNFWSLAGYVPLWAGLATPQQAAGARARLARFEYDFGLAASQRTHLNRRYRQWDYPNGWANLHWLVIVGLLKYGFREDARRIAAKWVSLNTKVFVSSGKFWERYDVVRGRIPQQERYPLQSGFGWTNAIYVRLLQLFPELGQGE